MSYAIVVNLTHYIFRILYSLTVCFVTRHGVIDDRFGAFCIYKLISYSHVIIMLNGT